MPQMYTVDAETRNIMRKEIWTVLAQTGNYSDKSSIEKSTMDFEEKIYNTCGTSVSAYKKSIEGKLGKIRSAFIPPDFDSRRKRYTEWFNTNQKLISQLQKRPDWDTTKSPNMAKYLSAHVNAQFINLTQLDELAAIKAEYTRLYSAAVQKYKQKKEAALGAPEAARELCTALQDTCGSIADGLKQGQVQLCQRLNLIQLQENLGCLSDHLTPFFILKKKRTSDSASQPACCAVCPSSKSESTSSGVGASGNTKYMNLKEKFTWGGASSATAAENLFALLLPRLDLLLSRFEDFQTQQKVTTDSEAMGCVTSAFVQSQGAHFLQLESWLRGLVEMLQEVVIPFESEKVGSKSSVSNESSKKRTVPETERCSKYSFRVKRALNLSSYTEGTKRVRTNGSQSSALSPSKGTTPSGELPGVEGLSSLSEVASAVQQQLGVQVQLCPGGESGRGGLRGFCLLVSLQALVQPPPCPQPTSGAKGHVTIAVDKHGIPVYVATGVARGAGSEVEAILSPSAASMLPIYRRMNQFLATERCSIDFNSSGSSHNYDVVFVILSKFINRFRLSDTGSGSSSCSRETEGADALPPSLSARLVVTASTGLVRVECAATS